MRLPRFSAAVLLAAATVSGCSVQNVQTWLASCADCGQVRSITPRPLRNEIRLITDAPQAQYISMKERPPVPIVYDVRIRMDRGGARDLVVSDPGKLAVGDRVEVQGARIVPQSADSKLLWL